jgi:hypothetical protein
MMANRQNIVNQVCKIPKNIVFYFSFIVKNNHYYQALYDAIEDPLKIVWKKKTEICKVSANSSVAMVNFN